MNMNMDKIELLNKTNKLLKLEKNKIVFVYSAPKVGSTSIVSSLRIFAMHLYDIVHIHDEAMLKVLCGIEGIEISDIIEYNASLGKQVFVIDVYRSPIEHKISIFFEKIGSYHFNVADEVVNSYSTKRIIDRFNHIYPHLSSCDTFRNKYNIKKGDILKTINEQLLTQSFVHIVENNITYIKLKLNCSKEWSQILSRLLQTRIIIVKDYETKKKKIKDIFQKFMADYKIPYSYLMLEMDSVEMKLYYTKDEQEQYYKHWASNSTNISGIVPYTTAEYTIYNNICLENAHLDYIQSDHYIDMGCKCKGCEAKRKLLRKKLIQGEPLVNDCVIHEKVITIRQRSTTLNTATLHTARLMKKINTNTPLAFRVK